MDSTALTTTTPQGVFSGIQAFEEAQRIAKALASSTLIPQQFQGQAGYANCLVALNISRRMGMDPLMVMQNLHIIHGRPSWSSQFIIGLVNGCGRFSPVAVRHQRQRRHAGLHRGSHRAAHRRGAARP